MTRTRVTRRGGAAALLAAVALVGCGPKPRPTGEVAGTVTYKNAPVSAGTVKFVPEGGGDTITADLGPDGTYRATNVPVGKAKVSVETLNFKNVTPPPAGMAKMMGGPKMKYVAIPPKYEKPESSNLAVEVVEGAKEWKIVLE